MQTAEQIRQHLRFLPIEQDGVVAYQITANANGDTWENILVLFNGNDQAVTVDIPTGNWTIVLKEDQIEEEGLEQLSGKSIKIASRSAVIAMN